MTSADYRILTRTALCSGHARCHAVAPEIFDLNADGYNDTVERTIDAGALEAARRGMRACPERAISIVHAAGQGELP
ncbi:MAG: ferredoxin [Caulobacterales bacterium]